MKYAMMALLFVGQLGATTLAECRSMIDIHGQIWEESDSGPQSCGTLGAWAGASYGMLVAGVGVYYYDPPYYFETADAWASFSQQATITGRPTGTPGFYRLYGIQVLGPSVGPGWGLEDLAPWVPFTFGVPFEIRGDLHLYRSEGFEVNNLVMYGMEVFDVNKNLLWTFGDRNYWEDRDHIFVQQSPEAVYAIPTPEPASIALILPALVLLYAYRERLKQHV
ncbi:MAG: hypothetical protein LC130_28830 [Bryobacterales bacterium]|nr:hypothetical protein [Bryobacterales bacterium]